MTFSARGFGSSALNRVSLNVRPGTVHALMGENGAGKSTLMKCLFGICHPDGGEVVFRGESAHFSSVKNALDAGISMIQQELSNVPDRTVAQNIWMGREPLLPMKGVHLINHKNVLEETEKLLSEMEMDINPNALMSSLSISMQRSAKLQRLISTARQSWQWMSPRPRFPKK